MGWGPGKWAGERCVIWCLDWIVEDLRVEIFVTCSYMFWLVVWNMTFMTFPKNWEFHHPN